MYNLIYVRNLKRFHLLNLFTYLQEFSDEPMSKDIVVNAKLHYLVLTYADKTSIFRMANERKKKNWLGWAIKQTEKKEKKKTAPGGIQTNVTAVLQLLPKSMK